MSVGLKGVVRRRRGRGAKVVEIQGRVRLGGFGDWIFLRLIRPRSSIVTRPVLLKMFCPGGRLIHGVWEGIAGETTNMVTKGDCRTNYSDQVLMDNKTSSTSVRVAGGISIHKTMVI